MGIQSSADPWNFDPAQIDQDDPFEIDERNRPHLAKHPPYTEEDLFDAFFGAPLFVRAAHEPAHLLMIAPIPGDMVVVPIMPAQSANQIRPLGIYRASRKHKVAYDKEP